eukprot:TRINITY_DN55267_c0_g1_i1.p1 TRINITY_DN55267_c0_g1~~TRINITY_DN55267_c0_g1_i1.p1  ORF type:complete len:932 (+),score=122.02 TRINITY_DN55267_c0_g1_i1:78-2873(+)
MSGYVTKPPQGSDAVMAPVSAASGPLLSPGRSLSKAHMKGLKMERAKDELLEFIVEKSAKWRHQMLEKMGVTFKEMMLCDPDMWPWLRRSLSTICDSTWADIASEIERNIQLTLAKQQVDAEKKGPSSSICLLSYWLKFRAFFLHHYLPHDKSIFGKLKDPVYLFITLLTILPINGVRVMILILLHFMLVFPDGPDEFQLVGFITLVKGTQFLTSGFITLTRGTLAYFLCYSMYKEDLLQCMDKSFPSNQSAVGQILDYVGACALVWSTFWRLQRLGRLPRDGDVESNSSPARDSSAGRELLRKLLRYDVQCFVASLIILVVLTLIGLLTEQRPELTRHNKSAQQKANVFWCCTLYSVLSFPFLIFNLPKFLTFLTHSNDTGYNEHGACVEFNCTASMTPEAEEEYVPPTDAFARWAPTAMRVVRTAQRWGEARRATRGIFARRDKPTSDEACAASSLRQRLLAHPEPCGVERKRKPSFWRRDDTEISISDAVEESIYVLDVASIAILEETEARRGHQYYCIHVIPTRSLDGYGSSETWYTWRRYADFRALYNCLRQPTFEDAPFPGKHMFRQHTKELVDQRRRELQSWLLHVVRQVQHDQNRLVEHLASFLQAEPPPWAVAANLASKPENDKFEQQSTAVSGRGVPRSAVNEVSSIVASVQITGRSQERGQSVAYKIETLLVAPVAETNAPWVVHRSYTDFRKLSQRVGQQCLMYAAAPFPGKELLTRKSEEMLSKRQEALLTWLRHIVADPETPAEVLLDFLRPTAPKHEFSSENSETAGFFSRVRRGGSGSTTPAGPAERTDRWDLRGLMARAASWEEQPSSWMSVSNSAMGDRFLDSDDGSSCGDGSLMQGDCDRYHSQTEQKDVCHLPNSDNEVSEPFAAMLVPQIKVQPPSTSLGTPMVTKLAVVQVPAADSAPRSSPTSSECDT